MGVAKSGEVGVDFLEFLKFLGFHEIDGAGFFNNEGQGDL